ncbi:MAG: diacylglycerol kinase [Bacilli bacterium]|jgi:undecaprenol kinase
MNLDLQEPKKKMGIKRFLNSIKYSLYGLGYAVKNEQSFTLLAISFFITLGMGFFFQITLTEWIYVLFASGLVLGIELINTAIEAIVDKISPEQNKFAKIAKDTGSAAAFLFTIMSLIIGLIVFIPYVIDMIGGK